MTSSTPQEDILSLLAQGLGEDLHWFPESVGMLELAETLAAMANTQGGKVILGVELKTGRVDGINDVNTAIEKIHQAAQMVEPVLSLAAPVVCLAKGSRVLIVSIPDGLPYGFTIEGRCLRRETRHNAPC